MALAGCKSNSDSSAAPKGATVQPQLYGQQIETLANGVKIEIQKVAPLDMDTSNYGAFKQSLNRISAKVYIPEEIAASVNVRKSVTVPGEFLVSPQFKTVNEKKTTGNGYYTVSIEENLWNQDAEDKILDLRPRTLTIKIYSKEGLLGESAVTFLPDLIVSTTEDGSSTQLKSLGIISGAYSFGVVFLEAKTVLETQGVDVKLQMNRLYVAEQASIISFSEAEASQEPEQGQNGRSGGVLELIADKADGKLSVFMRGTKGGKGLEAIDQNEIGTTGTQGAAGTTEKKCKVDSKAGGNEDICTDVCATHPANGSVGGKGPKGIKGGVGMRGGSSGLAKIIVTQPIRYFTADVFTFAGEGGPGGDGGKGGRGGHGGAPGNKPKVCQDAATGPQGPEGDRGDQGTAGDAGQKESELHLSL